MKRTIKKPVISEKSFMQVSENVYTFIVESSASKQDIKERVESIYKVSVVNVNTAQIPGKVKRYRGNVGRRSDYKKAYITLDGKSKIDLFEIEEEKAEDDKKDKKKKTKKAKSKKDNK